MGSFIAQELTLLHPQKVNRLLLYGASCGGIENIPQSPDVIKILSDLVYNRSQDVGKSLSVTFPQSWIKSHSNNISIPQSKEIVPEGVPERSHIFCVQIPCGRTTEFFAVVAQICNLPYRRVALGKASDVLVARSWLRLCRLKTCDTAD